MNEQKSMIIFLKVTDSYFDAVTVLDRKYLFRDDGLCDVVVPEQGTYSFKLHNSSRHITRSSTSLGGGEGTPSSPYIIPPKGKQENWEDD